LLHHDNIPVPVLLGLDALEAEPNIDHPELGSWQYTLVASWDTGTNYALSNMNLLLGAEDRCTCDDLDFALAWTEPLNVGMLTIVFCSNFALATIATPNLLLVDKHAQLTCSGGISGVFPGLPCDPVGNLDESWGTV